MAAIKKVNPALGKFVSYAHCPQKTDPFGEVTKFRMERAVDRYKYELTHEYKDSGPSGTLRSLRSISPAVENWEVFNSQIHVLVTLGLKDLALPLCDLDLSLGQCQINDPSALGAIMYNCYYHNLSNASTLCIADIVQHNEQH